MAEVLAFLTVHDGLALGLTADVNDRNRIAGRKLRLEILRRREGDIGLLQLRLGEKAGGE